MGITEDKHPRRDFLHQTGQKLVGSTMASTLASFSSEKAQPQPLTAPSAGTSPVTRCELDAAWPQKPESFGAWAGNPAVMVDSSQQVWVSNRAFPAMMIFDIKGKFIKAWGKEGVGPDEFIDPHAICHIREYLYVVDRGNIRIKVYDFKGKLQDIWRDLIIAWPLVPTTDDRIWACGCTPIRLDQYAEITNGKLQQDQIAVKFSHEGKTLQIWAFPTCPRGDRHVPGRFNMLHGICADAQGNLYLGEAFNPGPQKYICSNSLKTAVQGEFPPDRPKG